MVKKEIIPTKPIILTEDIKSSKEKFDFELYHQELDIPHKLIRVKRISLPNKEEKWKITENDELIFAIESKNITKRERQFLQTVEGFNFILKQAKLGIKNLNSFRNELKKILELKLEDSED